MTSEERYDEMLDDVYGTVEIAGYTFDTSRALKELDPTAYRCGLVDFEDSEESDRQQEAREESNL